MNVTELNRVLHEVTPFSCQSARSLENKTGHLKKCFFVFFKCNDLHRSPAAQPELQSIALNSGG